MFWAWIAIAYLCGVLTLPTYVLVLAMTRAK